MGFVETLSDYDPHAKIDLPKFADDLHFEIDDLFPITEVLEIMHFIQVSEGDVVLTDSGRKLALAEMLDRKKIFAKHLMEYVPLARHVRAVLDKESEHEVSETVFLSELETVLSDDSAEETLAVVIDWGRYAEIFAYDYNSGMLSLENPQ